MKPLSISIASAAILAAASFGANAQGQQPQQDAPGASKAAPSQSGGAGGASSGGGREAQAPAGNEKPAAAGGDKPAAAGADKPAGRADAGDKPAAAGADKPAGRADAGDKPGGKTGDAMNKSDAKDTKADANKADSKDAAASDSKDAKADGKSADKPDASKSADEGKGGDKPGKQAAKEIKPEQKTIIKQTIVKENVRPQKIDVQVRVGVAVPRSVTLYTLPPTIIEVYPAYQPYKFIMVDDDTILVIDPSDWTIVDVIQV